MVRWPRVLLTARWDAEAGTCLRQWNFDCDVHALAMLPDGALACLIALNVIVCEPVDGTPLLNIKVNVFRFAIAALTNGELGCGV